MNAEEIAEDIDEAIRKNKHNKPYDFGGNDVLVYNYGYYLRIELSNGEKFNVTVIKL